MQIASKIINLEIPRVATYKAAMYSIFIRGICILFSSALMLFALPSLSSADNDLTEKIGEYEVVFTFQVTKKVGDSIFLQDITEYEKEILIKDQLKFLYGGMALEKPHASPQQQFKIEIQKIRLEDGYLKIDYNFVGIFLIESPAKNLKFYLPIRPYEIYDKSLSSFIARTRYPCTNRKYKDEKYFWYYFNPLGSNCPLEYGVDYLEVKPLVLTAKNNKIQSAQLNSKMQSWKSLVQQDKAIKATVLFGMDDLKNSGSPDSSADMMAIEYNKLKQLLLDQGFLSLKWRAKDFLNSDLKYLVKPGVNSLPHLESFKKTIDNKNIQINLAFVASSFPDNLAMGLILRNSMMEDHITIYNGHAGFGGNLDLNQFKQSYGLNFYKSYLKPNILFLNSCSSYSYYRDTYSVLNPNMILITNGLETTMKSILKSNQKILNTLLFFKSIDSDSEIELVLENSDSLSVID